MIQETPSALRSVTVGAVVSARVIGISVSGQIPLPINELAPNQPCEVARLVCDLPL
jgi:hypothetical protein